MGKEKCDDDLHCTNEENRGYLKSASVFIVLLTVTVSAQSVGAL